MVVGEALSSLVDLGKKRLDFHMDETKTEEGLWYQSLVKVKDQVGDPAPLFFEPEAPTVSSPGENKSERPQQGRDVPKPTRKLTPPSAPQPKTRFVIEEIASDDEDEHDDVDLKPYAKPESDAEDSEEDPTLIRRDKPKAPVYTRDLVSYFRATDDYDRQLLALRTAPVLIRRKAQFGTEVSSQADTLASLLAGMDDKFDFDDFEEHRLQGMLALLTSLPEAMGPRFGRMVFEGDFNTTQRSSMLVAIGLAGREIAGLEVSKYVEKATWVGKRLPENIERLFLGAPSSEKGDGQSGRKKLKALPPTALDTITTSLAQRFLAPMAAEAADVASGPDALKLETYKDRLKGTEEASPTSSSTVSRHHSSSSTRPATSGGTFMSNGKIIRQTTRPPPVKIIPNTSSHAICTHLVGPLSSRLLPAVRPSVPSASLLAGTSSRSKALSLRPVLPLAIRTLSVLVHAAGPNTLSLPQMTGEFWDILLAVRPLCKGDLAMTAAVVEGFVALLDVNGVGSSGGPGSGAGATATMREGQVRELCQTWGREISETTEWVGEVFDGLYGGGGRGEGMDSLSNIAGKASGGHEDGSRAEEARVKALAAGVLIRLREVGEKYSEVLLGSGII